MADSRTVTIYQPDEKRTLSYTLAPEVVSQMAREEQKKKPDASYTDAAGQPVAIDWSKWRMVKIK